jgi:hypothetical protein
VRFLVSTRLSLEDLTSLARQVDADGTEVGAALPGQRVLFTGATSDVFPTLVTKTTNDDGISGVVYGAEADLDATVVIASMPGDDERWQAALALATDVEEATVRGNEAVIATFGLDVSQVSWLEDDGTLVRVEALDGDVTDVVPLLDQLVEVDDAAFAELVRNSAGPTNPRFLRRRQTWRTSLPAHSSPPSGPVRNGPPWCGTSQGTTCSTSRSRRRQAGRALFHRSTGSMRTPPSATHSTGNARSWPV